MKLRAACVVVGFLSLVLSLTQLTVAQTATQTASALPRLVRFGGTVKDLNGIGQSTLENLGYNESDRNVSRGRSRQVLSRH
jgi:hypothetical protein